MKQTIEWHPVLDSTNSYLLRKLEAGTEATGSLAVAALHQTAGRGQREKSWDALPGESLLLSVGGTPVAHLHEISLYSFGIAVTIVQTLERLFPEISLTLKWPNDLYVDGRKLGGILIENVLRGMNWHYSVVGLGMNVFQQAFPPPLDESAISLNQISHVPIPPLEETGQVLADAIVDFIINPVPENTLSEYNRRLYKKNQSQLFESDGKLWEGRVEAALPDGTLQVYAAEGLRVCRHGYDLWKT